MRQYTPYIKKWFTFAEEENFSPDQPTLDRCTQFLQMFISRNVSYSTVLTAKAAITHAFTLWNNKIFEVNSLLMKKFMKGVWNLKPYLSNNTFTWNPTLVLNFIDNAQKSANELTLLDLARFCVTILALATAADYSTFKN